MKRRKEKKKERKRRKRSRKHSWRKRKEGNADHGALEVKNREYPKIIGANNHEIRDTLEMFGEEG